MRALVADGYGPPDTLRIREIADPAPGAGQVLVRLRAAAVNPSDLALTSGELRVVLPLAFPYVVGMDGAGTVVAVGPEVTRFAAGDEVFGMFRTFPGPWYEGASGTLAEYAVAPADSPLLAIRPAGLDPVRAAALPEAGLAAASLLSAARLAAGEAVLVIGATGGIGTILVPLAAAAGARVLATASPEDAGILRRLGAAVALDHTAGSTVDAALRHHSGGVDVLIDLVDGAGNPAGATGAAAGTLIAAARAVRPGGRLLTPRFGPDPAAFDRPDLTVQYVMLTATPGDLDRLATAALDGTLPSPPMTTHPLTAAPEALTALATRHTLGKHVVTIL
jgi:NADPH:quinone reductase-like Zn-dependent oxidoreductase